MNGHIWNCAWRVDIGIDPCRMYILCSKCMKLHPRLAQRKYKKSSVFYKKAFKGVYVSHKWVTHLPFIDNMYITCTNLQSRTPYSDEWLSSCDWKWLKVRDQLIIFPTYEYASHYILINHCCLFLPGLHYVEAVTSYMCVPSDSDII